VRAIVVQLKRITYTACGLCCHCGQFPAQEKPKPVVNQRVNNHPAGKPVAAKKFDASARQLGAEKQIKILIKKQEGRRLS